MLGGGGGAAIVAVGRGPRGVRWPLIFLTVFGDVVLLLLTFVSRPNDCLIYGVCIRGLLASKDLFDVCKSCRVQAYHLSPLSKDISSLLSISLLY